VRRKQSAKPKQPSRTKPARTKPARKRKRQTPVKEPRQPSPFRLWLSQKLRRLLRLSAIVLLPSFLLYTLWLDFTVRDQFEGVRWELPAHVYAAPLELYAGKEIGKKRLLETLQQLGYQKSTNRVQGSYRQRNGSVDIHSRTFQFMDGEESAVNARVYFEDGRITSIEPLSGGDEIDIIRLDPLLIGNFFPAHGEDRILIQLDALPEILVQTLLTVEDRGFYDHFGINPLAIARAMAVNIRAGKMVQGGSTLTQQLAKNLFLNRDRTLWRKVREALITLILESHYEKSELLEAYLNEVYFGQDQQRSIHGVGMASQFFFGHDASQLTLAESALLVGMLKGPSRYNPRRHPKRAKQRRNLVLDLLVAQGVITGQRAEKAKRRSLGVLKTAPTAHTRYPAFIDLVRRQILHDYKREDLTSAGLRIFTTLKPIVQDTAEFALQQRIQQLGNGQRQMQGAVVVVNPKNGEVEGVVGGESPRSSGFNRALNAVRPIGSLVKPALYLTALEESDRYTLTTILKDRPFQIRSGNTVWEPQNYDQESHGDVMLFQALSKSYNLSTARLGAELGIGRVAKTLKRLGVERPIPRYPSLFLGVLELSPLEVAQFYQPLAGDGIHTPLRAIRGVTTHQGEPLNRYSLQVNEVASAESIALLQWGLQHVVRDGTAIGLKHMLGSQYGLAGKTGTTDELKDSWYAGFSGDRLAVVWMGRDDNKPAGLTGSSGAMRVWGQLMAQMPITPLSIVYPESIVKVKPKPACKEAEWIPFVKGSEPTGGVQCDRYG
jgi:penicillin-binding protein 1B